MDRGHTVCSSGPYQFVRHPGYAGNLLAMPGIVMALDSVWTALPAGVAVLITLVRTALEDRTLHQELAGYPSYAQGVRFRLVPWIY